MSTIIISNKRTFLVALIMRKAGFDLVTWQTISPALFPSDENIANFMAAPALRHINVQCAKSDYGDRYADLFSPEDEEYNSTEIGYPSVLCNYAEPFPTYHLEHDEEHTRAHVQISLLEQFLYNISEPDAGPDIWGRDRACQLLEQHLNRLYRIVATSTVGYNEVQLKIDSLLQV